MNIKFYFILGYAFLLIVTASQVISAPTQAEVDVYFMPAEASRFVSDLKRSLKSAEKEVLVAAYWITNTTIIEELIALNRNKNLNIQIIYDSTTPNKQALANTFIDEGIIPLVADFRTESKMHNKFIVIDDKEVWTGSANFTGAARYSNNENMVIIKSEEIAKKYIQNFLTIQDELFQEYIKDIANNRLAIWKNKLITQYSEKSESFKKKLDIMRDSNYFDAAQKNQIARYFSALTSSAAQASSSSPLQQPLTSEGPTSKQRYFLEIRGYNPNNYTKEQATALIGRIKDKDAQEPAHKKARFAA